MKNFEEKIRQKNKFQHNSSKIQSGDEHNQGDIAIKFCRDLMSGFHFYFADKQTFVHEIFKVMLKQF